MEFPFEHTSQKSDKTFENIEALISDKSKDEIVIDFDQHINKCLSLILHYDDIKKMIEIIKKVHNERANKSI